MAEVYAFRSEPRERAQSVRWIFSLRALAASIMLCEQETWCRLAADKAVIHAGRSEGHTSNSKVVDKAAVEIHPLGGRCLRIAHIFDRLNKAEPVNYFCCQTTNQVAEFQKLGVISWSCSKLM